MRRETYNVSGETELGGQRIALFIFGRVHSRCLKASVRGGVVETGFCEFACRVAVMNSMHNFGSDNGALGHNAFHSHQISNMMSKKLTRRQFVRTKRAFNTQAECDLKMNRKKEARVIESQQKQERGGN
jgi:hypothetical protein